MCALHFRYCSIFRLEVFNNRNTNLANIFGVKWIWKLLLLLIWLIEPADQFLHTHVLLALKELRLHSNQYSVLCIVIYRSTHCFGSRVGKPITFCDLSLRSHQWIAVQSTVEHMSSSCETDSVVPRNKVPTWINLSLIPATWWANLDIRERGRKEQLENNINIHPRFKLLSL